MVPRRAARRGRRRRAGLIHAVFSIALRADQVVSGVAINFLAAGITGYVFIAHYGDQGTPGSVPSVPDVNLPIKETGFFGEAIGELNLLTWVALLLVPIVAVYLYRTPAGCGCGRWGRSRARPTASGSRCCARATSR